jgi:hypothetical protein
LGRASRLTLNRITLVGGCLLAALCAPRPVLAAGASYRLQVVRADGAGSCASASLIEREVSQRLGRNPFSDEGERGIDIVLSRTETKWVAKLYLRVDTSDADAARVIESDAFDCAELGKSVTLAVALAIAPDLPPAPAPRVTTAISAPTTVQTDAAWGGRVAAAVFAQPVAHQRCGYIAFRHAAW